MCHLFMLFMVITLSFENIEALISCNQLNVTKAQLCMVNDTNPDIHGYPDSKPGEPLDLKTALTLTSIADVNAEQNTILINIVISLFWNDTRISLTPYE